LNDNQLQSIDLSPLSHCLNIKALYLRNDHLKHVDLSPLCVPNAERLLKDSH
jgi:hypothetical protein